MAIPPCPNSGGIFRLVSGAQQNRSFPMDHNDIMLLMEMFLQPTYSIEDAIKLLGQIKDDSLPNWIVLKPKTHELELVKLERLEVREDSMKKTFLASIFIRYVDTISVSFSKISQKYGQPNELPRLKPHGDIPYRFDVKEKALRGNLILFVKGRTEKDVRPVHSIQFTRYLPEKQRSSTLQK
jgi:hypothetical protein